MQRLRTAGRRAGQLAGRAFSEFFEDGCPQRAAAISYYALLSLFPVAILAVAGIGLILDDQAARDRVIGTVLEQLPLRQNAGRREIEDLLREATSQSGAFSVVGALTLLLAASGVMGAIRHALNAAWEVEDPRPPLQGKLLDVLLVVAFGVLVGLSFALTLVLRLTDELAEALGGAGSLLEAVVGRLAGLAPVAVAFATFAILLRLVPAAPTPLRDTWPGVLVATGGYELAKVGFAFYLENFARYGAVYGSLGTAVAFMVFVFVAANVALLGAQAASEWPAVRAGRLDGQDAPSPPLRERLRGLFVASERPPAAERRPGGRRSGSGGAQPPK